MKKIITTIAAVVVTVCLFSQSPQKMSYQAVIRNNSNVLVTSSPVGMRVSILQGSPTGTEVYKEIYNPNPQTNANGLVTIEIGGGIPLTGTFSTIDWSSGPSFLKTETDPAGGTNYTISGTSQLLSVPFALYAKSVASYPETDPVFVAHPANGITGTSIANWAAAYNWGNHANAGYVPEKRTITINKTELNLSENQSWMVGTVTSVGLSLPAIFSLSGSPVTTTGTLTATLASQTANQVLASPNSSAGAPAFRALVAADIPGMDWSKITAGKPTTLDGYGITDAVNATGNQTIAGNKTFTGTPLAPTAAAGTNTTQIATTAFITSEINARVPVHYIGESYGGGIVFYVYDNGQHGLIAATADQNGGVAIRWYGGSYTNTRARSDGVGAGLKNTAIIIANQGPVDGNAFAATVCNEYSVTVDGVTYGDWYLPSRYELNLLYLQNSVVGGFAYQYWSSTEDNGYTPYNACYQAFNGGGQGTIAKVNAYKVRAIRAF
jgi:hypothetical protein